VNELSEPEKHRPVIRWLLCCCGLVFIMICVGGITRLTHSGLSIVEWQPIVGTIPPLTEGDWEVVFEKYRATPEYIQVNKGMSLQEFKGIFWWEYGHRLLGRVIGAAFLIPFLWFIWTRRIQRRDMPKMVGIFILGGLQGAMGWYMVASGLVDDPRVSHLRLTAHLGLAVLIYAAMFWLALNLKHRGTRRGEGGGEGAHLKCAVMAMPILVFCMILSGGLVAGIRAGFAYNTFPLMNGHWIPPEILLLEPWYLNIMNNMAMVQFNHRMLALVILLLAVSLWFATRSQWKVQRLRHAMRWLLGLVCLQIGLGITTLLLVVPIPLAALHQAGAILVFTASLALAHAFRGATH